MSDRPPIEPTIANVPVEQLTEPRRVITTPVSWRVAFAALRHRNFRLFFAGQGISLVGTWMHSVALGWLVYEVTRSTLTLGFVSFLSALPVTIFAVVGGNLADRVSKRRILIWTQVGSLVLALMLGTLVWLGNMPIWQIAAIGILLGTAHAFDIPARQSFVVEMVGKADLMNAIALNSSLFNTARVLGPALAGVLISTIGAAGCFWLNGLSYFAVIASYLWMRLPTPSAPVQHSSVWEGTQIAMQYIRQHGPVRRILMLMAVCSLFGFQYTTLLPVFTRDILHGDARMLGFLTSANGAGALTGAMLLASFGHRLPRRTIFPLSLTAWSMASVVFAYSTSVWLSAAMLVLAGIAFIVGMGSANTLVQLSVPDALRGRVMGVYTMAFLGVAPFGALLLGAAANLWGAPLAIAAGMTICLLAALSQLRTRAPDNPANLN
ncbi:MAG: Enterobactin exporter EntS [Verrucomicrobiae bacterium]|nr:Enterobactin exporter EntS [Verrucomicrobiae bacterium]